MKGYCFLILAVAFLMYFQREPIFTVIVLAIGLGIYLFVKAKKSGKGFLGFMGGNEQSHRNSINDLVTLIVLQQLFSEREPPRPPSEAKPSIKEEAESTVKQETLKLFDKYEK